MSKARAIAKRAKQRESNEQSKASKAKREPVESEQSSQAEQAVSARCKANLQEQRERYTRDTHTGEQKPLK